MIRVGQGHDTHALVAGRKLVIGGVDISHPLGLLGHSDADVLVHAIIDALLGAAGLGDIGTHFPDSDARYRGADGRALLRATYEKLALAGWHIVNVDSTIHAERPKMAPHIAQMVAHIASDLQLPENCVSVKAKTGEGLGFIGREEGIASAAVALIERNT
jgi:2-C-methyl-D-erythritol 2,4-cyclodiphosphate synthase